MTNELKTQVQTLAKRGMTPAEISEALGLEQVLVDSALVVDKGLREQLGQLFVQEHALRARDTMVGLLDCEDPGVRFRAASFVLDDHRGLRQQAVAASRGVISVSVNLINQAIARARESQASVIEA